MIGSAFKIIAGALMAVILGLSLRQQGKDIALLLSIVTCCMVVIAAVQYIKPIIAFLENLQELADLQDTSFQILLKAVGISLIAEIAGLVCSDSGNAALGKSIQIITTGVLLWLALPLMNALLEMVQKILGEL